MSGLVRPIDAAVRFSTLIDPSSEIGSSTRNRRQQPSAQVVAEGAGRGGTSAGRGGARGTHCGHRGPLGAVAQPLAAERHLTWCRAAVIRAGHGGRLRLSFLGFPAIQKRLLQAIDHMKGLDSQSGSRRRQSQVTLSRMGLPWAAHSAVRAAAAVAGQDGLPATSAKHKSWRAMYSGPGEPSGATWRPRWRPLGLTDGPDTLLGARATSPGREKG